MKRLVLAGALAVAALGVPAVMAAGAPAQAAAKALATTCTPGSSAPADSYRAVIDTASPDFGKAIAFHGSGFTTCGGAGSTIGVKLIDLGGTTKYARPDSSVNADRGVWAVVHADADGTFKGSFVLPDGSAAQSAPALTAGAYQLAFLTGSLDPDDPIRSAKVAFAVGGATVPSTPAEPSPGAGGGTTCKPTTATARVHLGSTTAELGGLVHVTGSGFCNPAGGGSVIGVKLDDGLYAHPGDSNTWAKIQANDTDGTFSADIRLPDGSAATSTPAFKRGAHTLRFLTGSLAAGDAVRTIKSATFSIGAYAPSDLPDPLAATDLGASTRHGAKVLLKKQKVVVRLPQTPAGTWVLATLYDADGSPSYPWESWRQLPADHQLTLARKPIAATGASGRLKLAVQSGDDGHVGDLLGWAPLKLPATGSGTTGTNADPSASGGSSHPVATAPSASGTTSAVVGATGAPAAPPRPFASYTALDLHRHGSVRARSDTGQVTLTIGSAKPGDLVYVDVYTPTAVLPAGWATVAADRTVKLDLTSLDGYAGATVQSADGTLLGWAPLALGDTGATDAATTDASAASAASAAAAAAGNAAEAIAPAALAAASGATSDSGWLTGTDGLLLAAGAVVLAGASLVPARRRRTPGGAA